MIGYATGVTVVQDNRSIVGGGYCPVFIQLVAMTSLLTTSCIWKLDIAHVKHIADALSYSLAVPNVRTENRCVK